MTDDQGHLFDPPGRPRRRRTKKPGELWVPPALRSSRASPEENERVRALLKDHITRLVGEKLGGRSEAEYARQVATARGEFARYSVELGQRLQLRTWGNPRKLHHRRSPEQARLDAAYTNLRQFWMGRDLAPWGLCLIEATICDVQGMALPPCAYATQRTLDQAAAVRARRGEAPRTRPRPRTTRPKEMW